MHVEIFERNVSASYLHHCGDDNRDIQTRLSVRELNVYARSGQM